MTDTVQTAAPPGRASYRLVENIWMRALGLIFLIAFWSLSTQMVALAGARGLAPAAEVLAAMRAALGPRVYLLVPTVFWANASDTALQWACYAGLASAVVLFGAWRLPRWAEKTATAVCLVLYLSLCSVGQPFTMFQWDALLIECAFLSLFTGNAWLPWAFRILLFRLMFESGLVKLVSGDPNWRNLHALRYHFMTQPLPNPPAWYAYWLPATVLDALTFIILAVELACPFLLFCGRRARYGGAALLIVLQLSIIMTGNYTFFNWLTIAVCFWAFDDERLGRIPKLALKPAPQALTRFEQQFGAAILVLLMALGISQAVGVLAPAADQPVRPILHFLAPYQIVNSYGLFAVMTTSRPELIFEGSADGTNWREYEFPYKPGNVRRSLPVVAPFQPRLDWQLWFAALSGSFESDRWTGNLVVRLLEGEPHVMKLLAKSPFAQPPRQIRVSLYEYFFTTPAERKRTGPIWNRRFIRQYLPPVSLDMVRQQQ